jgi:ubiquinone biosynthesis O-methyltransferase
MTKKTKEKFVPLKNNFAAPSSQLLEDWRLELDRYITSKLVDPNNSNRKRWVFQSPEYELHHTDSVIELLRRIFPDLRGRRILDFGCGAGLDCINLARLGASVTGMEIDETLLRIATLRAAGARVDVAFKQIDGASWTAGDKFDIVIMADVIEHVSNPVEILKRPLSLLNEGGYLFVSTPNRWAISNILADPHWKLTGVSLMPRPLAKWYVTRFRKVIREYDVQDLIGFAELAAIVNRLGCETVYDTMDEVAGKMAHVEFIQRRGLRWVSGMLPRNSYLRNSLARVYAHFTIYSWWVLARKVGKDTLGS